MKQLDKKFLVYYYQEMVDDLFEIFDTFLDETPEDIKSIRNCLSRNDFETAADITHKIIPSFTSIGLPNLSNELKEIEDKINPSNAVLAKLLLDDFDFEVQSYMPAILAEHQRLKEYHTQHH
jgi:HPt (histidine-containing phosphotransfer) domain-containing protein